MERYSEEQLLSTQFESREPIFGGLFNKGENVLLIAPQKGAKSMFTLEMAVSAAHGLPLLGRFPAPRPQRVLYVGFEGTSTLLQEVLRRIRGLLGISAFTENLVLARAPYLWVTEEKDFKGLEELVDAHKPDLLILDPFYRIHKGDVNSSSDVSATTGALNALSQAYGHATWIPHHEHRERTDMFGAKESDKNRYAGSWVLPAWCDAMFGFIFKRDAGTAVFKAYNERSGGFRKDLELSFVDEPDRLGFLPDLESRVIGALPMIAGMSIRRAAEYFDTHPEQIRRVLTNLTDQNLLYVVPGGAGKESRIEVCK